MSLEECCEFVSTLFRVSFESSHLHAQIAAVWSMALGSASVRTVKLGREVLQIDALKDLVLQKCR